MPSVTELKNVPRDRVGFEVQQAIYAGAVKVECEKQSNGKWTIRAHNL
jgi:hypothetical protein